MGKTKIEECTLGKLSAPVPDVVGVDVLVDVAVQRAAPRRGDGPSMAVR